MFSKPKVIYFYGDCGEDEQKRVTNLMKKHGASVDFNVSDKCTHVISKTADFPDYVKAAAKKSIYIVTPEWVTQSAAKKKRLPESDFLVKAPEPAVPDLDESGQPGPRLFVGVRAAAVQMNATDKHRLAAIVRHHGGDFTGTLTPDSTHLIMLQPSGPIYLAAESRGLFIVSVQWVTESVSVGMRLDESDYALDMFTVEEKSSALAGLQRVPLPRSALENGVLAPVASILALPSPRPIPTAAPAPPAPATPMSPPRLKSAPSAVPAPAPAPASVPESEPTPVQSPPAAAPTPKPAILSRTRSTSGKPAATTPAAKRSSTIVESEEDVTMEDVPEPPKPTKTPSVKGVPAIVDRPRHNDDDDNDMDEEMLKAQPILRGVSTARRAGVEPAAVPPPAITTTTTTTTSAIEGVVATSTVSNAKPPARGPRSRQSSVAAAASAPDPVTEDNDEASAAGKVVVVAASAPAVEEDASEVTVEPETPTTKGGRGKKGAKKAAAAKKPTASAKKTPVAPSPSAEKSGPGDSSSTVEEEMPKSAKSTKKKALTPKPEPMEGVEQEAHVMLGDTRTTTPVLPEPPKEKEKEKSQPPLARTTSSGSRRSEVVKPEPSKGSKVLAPESPPQANSPTAVSPKAGVAFRPASFSQAKDAEAAPVTAAARAPSREASAAKAPLTVEVTAKETTPVAAPVVTTPTASQEQLRDLFLGTTFLVVYGNTEYCEKAIPELKKAGARIAQLPDIAGVTHVLARQLSEPGVDEARAAGAEVVSSFWLHDCFQERAYLSTHRKPIYMPPPSMQPVPDLPEKLLISFTGYVDDIRKELITMIEIMAGVRTVIDTNLKTAHTHLICLDSTGDKYKHASKWHIPRVTHRWIEAMFKNHRYIPETDFVFLQSNEAELKAEINARMVKNIQPEERMKYLQYKEATAPRPPPPVEVHPADTDATLDYGNEIGGGWGEVQVGGTGAMDTGGDEWISRPLSRARSTGPPSRGVESNTTAGTVVAPDDKARGQGSGAAAAGDVPNGDGKSGEEEPVPASEKKKRGKRAPKTPTESTRTPRPRGKKPAAAAPPETPARTTSGSKAASARKRRRTDSDDEHDAGGDSATQDGDEAMGDVAEAEVETEFETPQFKEPPKPVKPFFEEPSFEEPMSQFTSALISRQSPFAKPVQAVRKFSKPTTAQREANREYDYMDSQDNAGPATQESWQSPDEAPPPKKKQRRGSVTATTDMDVAHTTTTSTTSTTNGPAPTSPTATTTKRQSSTLSRQPSVAAGPVSQPPMSDEAPTRVVPNFKKMHIMISCPRVDTQRLTKTANNLGIDVVPSQNASSLAPNATHIFMDSVNGDERFYCGLAKGLWFVRSSYLDKCSSVKKALPMEDYYEDTSERFGNVEIWSGAMRRWRQHREQTDKGAFEGWKVYCKGKLPMVRPILQAGGATLVRNLNDETIKDITCVITSESDEDEDPMQELMPYFETLDGKIHDRDWIKRYLAEDPKKSPP